MINIRVYREIGFTDCYRFRTWAKAVEFMRRLRRAKTEWRAVSFDVFFDTKE
jgi:hypothetical protein